MRFGLPDGQEYTQKEVADIMGISQSYISRLEKRISECVRLGYTHIIIPKVDKLPKASGVKFSTVATLGDAVRILTGQSR